MVRSPEDLLREYETSELPPKGLIREILDRSEETVDLLLERVARPPPDPDPDRPVLLTPPDVRAAWALLHLREPRLLGVLARALCEPDREELGSRIVFELPAWGLEALPILLRVFAAESAPLWTRAGVAESLGELALGYPEIRPEVTTVLGRTFDRLLAGTERGDGHSFLASVAHGLLIYGDASREEAIRSALAAGRFSLAPEEEDGIRVVLHDLGKMAEAPWAAERFDLLRLRGGLDWVLDDFALEEDEFLDDTFDLGDDDYDDEDESGEPPPETIRRLAPKVGRNAPCPCGSGKKYKRCCG